MCTRRIDDGSDTARGSAALAPEQSHCQSLIGPRTVLHDCQVMRRITSVIARPMIGSAIGCSECDDDRRGDHGEAHVGVGSGVVAVCDQRGAVESLALRPGERGPRCSCPRSRWHRRGRATSRCVGADGVDEALHGLDARDAGADEDRGDDCQSGATLRDPGVQGERDPQRHGREGIAEVVDQVGEQRDAAAGEEHRRSGRGP